MVFYCTRARKCFHETLCSCSLSLCLSFLLRRSGSLDCWLYLHSYLRTKSKLTYIYTYVRVTYMGVMCSIRRMLPNPKKQADRQTEDFCGCGCKSIESMLMSDIFNDRPTDRPIDFATPASKQFSLTFFLWEKSSLLIKNLPIYLTFILSQLSYILLLFIFFIWGISFLHRKREWQREREREKTRRRKCVCETERERATWTKFCVYTKINVACEKALRKLSSAGEGTL